MEKGGASSKTIRTAKHLAIVAAYLIWFAVLDRISLSLRSSAGISLKFLPEGLNMALLLEFGWGYAPLLLIRPFFKGLWVHPGPIGPQASILFGLVSVCIYFAAAQFLRSRLRFDTRFPGLKEALRFVAIILPAAFIVAAVTVAGLMASGFVPRNSILERILRIWMGEAIGLVSLTPFLLAIVFPKFGLCSKPAEKEEQGAPRRKNILSFAELVLQASALISVVALAFMPGMNPDFKHYYFCFIPVLWITLRNGFRGAMWGVLAVNAGILIVQSEWAAPIQQVADTQLFVLIITLTSLFLGAAVSDRRKAMAALIRNEAVLRQVQKMETAERLAGGIAHEFNNLLAVIIGYSDVVLGRDDLHESARSNLAEIKKAGERAAKLTESLLTLSRKRVLAISVLNLNAVVASMEPILTRLVGEGVFLGMNISAVPAWILVHPGQLEQVVLNLVLNAREAMPHGGRIEIATGRVETKEPIACFGGKLVPGSYPVLDVSDTGVGMDAELQSRIFEPFFTTKVTAKVAGLGLSTVYGIMEQAGGKISVHSEPGRGTIFRLYFKGAPPSSWLATQKMEKEKEGAMPAESIERRTI